MLACFLLLRLLLPSWYSLPPLRRRFGAHCLLLCERVSRAGGRSGGRAGGRAEGRGVPLLFAAAPPLAAARLAPPPTSSSFSVHLYPQVWKRLELIRGNLEPPRFKAMSSADSRTALRVPLTILLKKKKTLWPRHNVKRARAFYQVSPSLSLSPSSLSTAAQRPGRYLSRSKFSNAGAEASGCRRRRAGEIKARRWCRALISDEWRRQRWQQPRRGQQRCRPHEQAGLMPDLFMVRDVSRRAGKKFEGGVASREEWKGRGRKETLPWPNLSWCDG